MGGSSSQRGAVASLRRREVGTLVAYAVALLACAVPLASMLVGAWDAEGIGYHLVWGLVLTFDLHIDAAVVFPFGLFVGLLTVLWFDDVKRIQAALITLAVVPATLALWIWRWDANVAFLDQFPVLAVGVAIGFFAAGGRRVFSEDSLREFRRAFAGMYGVATVLLVGSFFETHLQYVSPIQRTADGMVIALSGLDLSLVTEGIVVDAVATVAFVAVFREFVRYEDTRDIAVLGPSGSGKTTMAAGLFGYAAADESIRCTPKDANYELRELLAELDARPGFGDFDAPNRPGSFTPLEFEFMDESLFSRYVTGRLADYEGDLTGMGLVDAVRSAVRDRQDRSWIDRLQGETGVTWPSRETDMPPAELSTRMAELVCESDTLVLVVPMADFVGDVDADRLPAYYDPDDRRGRPDPETYLREFDEVLTEYERLDGDRDVVVVVTMSDLVVEEFKRENPGAIVEDYEEFRSYVRHRVFVVDETGSQFGHYTDDVYPFYFEIDADGTPRTDAGSVYGARELLQRIARR